MNNILGHLYVIPSNNILKVNRLSTIIFSTICLLLTGKLAGQDGGRYLQPTFDEVIVTSGIQYSSGIREGQNAPTSLYFDFYEPVGDTLTARPLVITVFGGAFVAGSRDFVDMAEYGNRLAKLGYAVASIDYRLLQLNSLSAEGFVRTAYMAAQDVSSAIRFFKHHNTEYRIDTNNIFLLGNSAGSIAILHQVFLSEDERPSETFNEPDLGPINSAGFEEYAGHSSKVAGIIPHWGGVTNTNIIQADEYVPVCMIHGTNDKVVPYDSGYCYSSTAAFIMPYMYGSHSIAEHLSSLGINDYEFHPFENEGHCFYIWGWNVLLDDKFDSCFNITRDFLYEHLNLQSPSAITNVSIDSYHIYPNPADDVVSINNLNKENTTKIELFDLNGQLRKQIVCSSDLSKTTTLSVRDLPAGVYLLHLTYGNNRKFVRKITVL